MQKGALGRDIKTRFGRARVLICADALDPWSIFSVASKPFEVLIVLADASRFAGSGLAEMHLRRTRVRAMEAGTPALFVEQSSTLALINAKGEVERLDQATRKPGPCGLVSVYQVMPRPVVIGFCYGVVCCWRLVSIGT